MDLVAHFVYPLRAGLHHIAGLVSSPRSNKTRAAKSNIKFMSVAFFDNEGIMHHEFVPGGTSVTAAFYKDDLTPLRGSIRRKRPQKWKNDWALHHDNAPSHTAIYGSSWIDKWIDRWNKYICADGKYLD
jgi:hypothetical protein